MSSRKRVLLTGATGHVGGRLFERLATSSMLSVRAVLRTARQLPSWASGAEIEIGDLSDVSVRSKALADVDTVVHLATRGFSAAVTPSDSELEAERQTAAALAREAVSYGVPRYLFVSSIHVYGRSLDGRVTDHTPTLPSTAYGKSRQQIEEDLLACTSGTETHACVLRLTNSFGTPALPRPETWNLLIHDLCRQAVSSARIVLRSDPRTSRDVMALRDVAHVMTEVIISTRRESGVFLLASGRSLTIQQLAERVQMHADDMFHTRCQIENRRLDASMPPSFTLIPQRLKTTGIDIPNNLDDEIRDLLVLAAQEFGSSAR